MKLDIGCGESAREGFIGVDRKTGGEAYPLRVNNEPVPDNSVEEIVASHVLEHFGHRHTLAVLKEWVRVLKPAGTLRIAVPNLKYACDHPEHPHFEGWVMGGQTDNNDYHGALFWPEKLTKLLEEAGLESVEPWNSDKSDCASLPVSLNLQGTKPLVVPKICCALSLPRVGFNDMWGCLFPALQPWNIPIRRYQGVWWERSLQDMFEDLLEEGCELVVVVDGDSAFSAKQFNTLLREIIVNPEIDAIAPLQPQRGGGLVMCTPSEKPADKDTHTVDMKKPLKCDTAHFGLTILRLKRLIGIKKPWFLNIPGKDGSWRRDSEGIVDADIYFWNQWKAAGRTLYTLPWVSIGHLECMVSQIDRKTGQCAHQFPKDWYKETFGPVGGAS